MASSGKLIIVPTPLGNLGDVTKRSIEALEQCDVVCCEDTRVTGKLLAALGIKKRLERLDEASIASKAQLILDRIKAGEVIAYCSDAGMPGVSDPGQRLIARAYDEEVMVEVLPGPTAITTAYVASGFTAQSFYFGSFMPRKSQDIAYRLEQLRDLDAVLIFYESPKRLVKSLKMIAELFPHRMVAVCRELTKLHEEVVRGKSTEVFWQFQKRESEQPIKGEIVVLIDTASHDELIKGNEDSFQQAQIFVEEQRVLGTMTKKDVVKELQTKYGLSRNDAYGMVHNH